MLAANAASYAAYSAPNAPPPTKAYLERARASVDEPASRKGAGTSFGHGESPEVQPKTRGAAAVQRFVHAYTVWPARNTFCCWGFCMTGPNEDSGPNTCAWLTMVTPMGLFFYTWGEVLARDAPQPLQVGMSAQFLPHAPQTLAWLAIWAAML